ncbi:hypothetical protein A3D84_02320 [Candidatus Woesebacteria bacterium RIFCSPHIGHO2_02_FULL_42_20]|uniref:Glycosyl transferase family 1 domain-containing protein n=1 Tax=Candidatus Woesebacteria bacterium RIFCSPHIGHO2_12_FULL_41_24 TaxID=1802510 RepID=A0A1F8ASS8_9BACT|nr:MAG: hypothetical protein A3D84_02320 [Candidatus Woesebacteria bacterium RIFCSPHIGHO2_02_FULL_42_20]OGM54804.1 MAG: hypothetical protein A3E44_01445 [Candidatus Woesebacteria bacterium RIFCSPHIGHO2_12_FULL_41_24]OGM71599.1 MAG: hypothetical protein A3I55_02450 [Candidatus Woesebacteria bacterium RIFCSPLOWO2_02_FULL_42_10]
MKIAIFHPEFAFAGGAERMTFEQIRYFKKIGWEVDCFTAFIDRENCYPDKIGEYEIHQILPGALNRIIPHQVMVVLATLCFALAFPAYCLLHSTYYNFFFGSNQAAPWWAFFASKMFKKPFAVYLNYPARLKGPLMVVDKFIVKQANTCFADGKFARLMCEKTYGRKFINCPGGVDGGKFSRKIWEARWRDPYILITNRHFPAKRIDYGIKILKSLDTGHMPPVTLKITGAQTKYTQTLKKLVKKYELGNRVKFLDLIADKDLKTLYRGALVYLYTAPSEDFGLGILEAMACGVPPVAWNNAGPKYIVENGKTGFLAKPGDLDNFTDKVKKLLVSRRMNFKMALAAHVYSGEYPWDAHARILEHNIKGEIHSLV